VIVVFFCGIQKKISIFKQLRILVVIRPWQPWKAQINHFDPVWSSLFMIGIRLITGSVFLTDIHTTCTHKIPFTFIPCFPLWYLFTISICLFVCLFVFVFWFSNFSCKFFVPSNSALKPFWGSSTYHTDIFFCTATTTLRSSWFWSWCKFEYFFVRYNFYEWCIVRFKVFLFFLFLMVDAKLVCSKT